MENNPLNNPRMATNIKRMPTKLLFVAISGLLFVAISGLPRVARAASLYFSPSSGSYSAGEQFSVGVYVSSSEQIMNAASGVISFPKDIMEIVSLSKNNSIFTLWVQEPSFSNSAGAVNFEGIVLNPGYSGASGKILGATFRVKAAGTANLTFSSGSVLANDGKGTNILASLGNAQFSLGGAAPSAPEAITPSTVSGTPSAPQISSLTHPDSNKWYSKSDAKFTWSVPSGVIGVRLLVSKIPNAVPTVTYIPPISSKEIPDLEDGVWYFHARFRNSAGWGETSHFRFQIDTQPPEPFSIIVSEKTTSNPQPSISFGTTDSLSGIDYYTIKIGEEKSFSFPPGANMEAGVIESNSYTLPPQATGKHTVFVQAFDKAGNYTVVSNEFTILPLEKPIVEIQKSLLSEFWSKISTTDVLVVILVSIIILLFYLMFVCWRLNRKFENFKKKIKKETEDVDKGINTAFELLQEKMKGHIEILKNAASRRGLTREEEKIFRDLVKDFNDTEKFLKKEVGDIKRVLK
jgi:hypothetical protein